MRRTALLLALVLVGVLLPFTAASAASGRYIVRLEAGADPEDTARTHRNRYGVQADRFYHGVIRGYAANVPEDRVEDLRDDPAVVTVMKNRHFRVAACPVDAECLPTGVDRVDADVAALTGSGVEVAVLDSGVDFDHPDLAGNLLSGVDCDGPDTGNYSDTDGHGTHVAGTVAALDNEIGVRGVAPGAKIRPIKILSNNQGTFDNILCGLEYVYFNAPDNGGDIRVANMSIEFDPFEGADDGACGDISGEVLHAAICAVVDVGVTVVVAAGNHELDIEDLPLASYDEVIAVTALSDWDGAPCGEGTDPTAGDFPDDTFASFSNFASAGDQAHTIGAPGLDILSTWVNGYAFSDGTSMASPHVAGAAARYLQTHPSARPSEVLSVLRNSAEPEGEDFNDECPGTTPSHTDPSSLHPEPVLRIVDWDLDPEVATPGIVRGNAWYLNNGFDGNADPGFVFNYGRSTDKIVVGDWDGDGVDTPGIVRGNVWYLNDGFDPFAEYVFNYGSATDRPIVGDWDGDGDDTPGVVRGNVWYLNNDHDPTSNVPPFAYGSASDRIIAGDWDGDGQDTPGIIRGNVWYLNDNFDPNAAMVFGFGSTTDAVVAGDWVGDGIDRPGLHRGNKYFLNLGFDAAAEIVFPYGLVSDRFVVGDWDGENP